MQVVLFLSAILNLYPWVGLFPRLDAIRNGNGLHAGRSRRVFPLCIYTAIRANGAANCDQFSEVLQRNYPYSGHRLEDFLVS